MTAPEVRALLEIEPDETLAASAAEKLDALASEETHAFMAAMFG